MAHRTMHGAAREPEYPTETNGERPPPRCQRDHFYRPASIAWVGMWGAPEVAGTALRELLLPVAIRYVAVQRQAGRYAIHERCRWQALTELPGGRRTPLPGDITHVSNAVFTAFVPRYCERPDYAMPPTTRRKWPGCEHRHT